ncbi:hypothetical protein C1646_754481 [Rhizophagus diaphanus]|nr:hypothetical protein C1646_754481 [Rhizophagus diaphanus] [Rhizophagus sp. MUCL 43196]
MDDNELNDDFYVYRDYRNVESIEEYLSGSPKLSFMESTTSRAAANKNIKGHWLRHQGHQLGHGTGLFIRYRSVLSILGLWFVGFLDIEALGLSSFID